MEKSKKKQYSKTIPVERKRIKMDDVLKIIGIIEKYCNEYNITIVFSDFSEVTGNDVDVFDDYLINNKKTDRIYIEGSNGDDSFIVVDFNNTDFKTSLGYIRISIDEELKYNALISEFTEVINCMKNQFFLSTVRTKNIFIILYTIISMTLSVVLSVLICSYLWKFLRIEEVGDLMVISNVGLVIINFVLFAYFLRLFPNIEFTFGKNNNRKIINILFFIGVNIIIPILIGLFSI